MKTLAQTLIHRRYVENHTTTRVVVLPLPDSGLPHHLVEAGQPVPLDLLAGRPVHLELGEEGFAADLCFDGPPVRCRFPWESVVAVQDASGDLVQTLAVTVATVMEDGSLRLAGMNPTPAFALGGTPPRPDEGVGGASPAPQQTAPPRRPRLRLVQTDDGSEPS